jgi:hypothetical protein
MCLNDWLPIYKDNAKKKVGGGYQDDKMGE